MRRGGVGLVVGLVLVTGCKAGVEGADGQEPTAAPRGTTATAPRTAPAPKTATTATTATTDTTARAQPSAATGRATPGHVTAAPSACSAADLELSKGPTDRLATADFIATQVLLRNRSAGTCFLHGWAGVTAYGYAPTYECGTLHPGSPAPPCLKKEDTTARRPVKVSRLPGDAPRDVVLAPGGRTSFALLWAPNTLRCDEAYDTPYGLRFTIPGDPHPLTLAQAGIFPCGGEFHLTAFGQTA